VSAIKKGAYDFLTKPFREGELLEKIQAAIAHHQAVKEQNQEVSDVQARVNCCTPREYDVMRLLIRGLPNKGIAETLGISPRTVEIHRAHVMEKMQAGSLPDLVRMVSLLDT
jgi:two-component system response regulator FixJ